MCPAQLAFNVDFLEATMVRMTIKMKKSSTVMDLLTKIREYSKVPSKKIELYRASAYAKQTRWVLAATSANEDQKLFTRKLVKEVFYVRYVDAKEKSVAANEDCIERLLLSEIDSSKNMKRPVLQQYTSEEREQRRLKYSSLIEFAQRRDIDNNN